MYDELKRVDILDSGIYFEFENIKLHYMKSYIEVFLVINMKVKVI